MWIEIDDDTQLLSRIIIIHSWGNNRNKIKIERKSKQKKNNKQNRNKKKFKLTTQPKQLYSLEMNHMKFKQINQWIITS